jgi:hypothetical protein
MIPRTEEEISNLLLDIARDLANIIILLVPQIKEAFDGTTDAGGEPDGNSEEVP